MNKEQCKRITFEQLIARKLQRDKDKTAVKEIYIPSMGGTLLFKKLPENEILELVDEVKNGNTVEAVDVSRKLIYMSCDALQNPELHKEMGIADPFDAARAVFSIEEANTIGAELLKFNGVSENAEESEKEIKN